MTTQTSQTQASDRPRPVHVLEFPGGYTRSTGPVIGRFLTGLRSGHLLGVRTPDGRVLVPPTEYDPRTAAALGGADEDWVEVGPAGTVTSWTWVDAPRADHPLDRPFAWALIKPDGADTAMLHAVDSGSKAAMATGMRVHATWRDERTRLRQGHRVLRSGGGAGRGAVSASRSRQAASPRARTRLGRHAAAPAGVPAAPRHGVEPLHRRHGRRARSARRGVRTCGKVYVPPRGACPADGLPATEWVDLPDTGVLTTFAVNNIPAAGAPEVPVHQRLRAARRRRHRDARAGLRRAVAGGADGDAGEGGVGAGRPSGRGR